VSGSSVDLLAFGRALAALAGVLLLLTASLWLIRRHGGPLLRRSQANGALAVQAALMLDTRTRLLVIRHGTVDHLLVVGPDGTSLLESRPAQAMGAPGPAP